jgi:hypothetical protein
MYPPCQEVQIEQVLNLEPENHQPIDENETDEQLLAQHVARIYVINYTKYI